MKKIVYLISIYNSCALETNLCDVNSPEICLSSYFNSTELFSIESEVEERPLEFPISVRISSIPSGGCLVFNQTVELSPCSSSEEIYLEDIDISTDLYEVRSGVSSSCINFAEDSLVSEDSCSSVEIIGFASTFLQESEEEDDDDRIPNTLPTQEPIGVNSPFGTRFKNIYTSIIISFLSLVVLLAAVKCVAVPDTIRDTWDSVRLIGSSRRDKQILEAVKLENNIQ
eukprot:snap_masked-scaffold_3-processed-gene-15.39-mRNA-1 protein AED:1.00 eAED:1.00 QI:0/-1/0/0/-1/1/1/0/226